MKRKYVILLAFIAVAFVSKAQTDTTAKLQDAHNQWLVFNSTGQSDTTVFTAMAADYNSVLGTDTLNASANNGMADIYGSLSNYWYNLAMPLQSSNPSLYNTYIQQSNTYSALAAPYQQRYLRIKGISN